jgi:hypothetical protein
MSWDIVYHNTEPLNYKIGDMWPAPHHSDSPVISKYYLEHFAKVRPPLMVVLPSVHCKNGDLFLIDRGASDDPDKKGWRVVINGPLEDGKKPDITMEPSINCVGSYHGYIRQGTITDDCDGRTYPSDVP